MAFTSLLICASALLVQSAYSACIGAGLAAPYGFEYGCGLNNFAAPLAYEGLAAPFGLGCGQASTGGGFAATSASPIAPVGVSVLSENVYEGGLTVGGNLPFLGTVGLEGILPTAGAGAVSYGCGAGPCAIAAEEGPIATGMAPYAGEWYNGVFGPEPFAAGYGFNGIFGPEPFAAGCGFNGVFGPEPFAAGYGYKAGLGYGYDGIGCGFAGKGFGINGLGYGAVY